MSSRDGAHRGRRAAAALLAAVFAMLLPAAIAAAWVRGTVLSTSGYVAAVTPLAADPTVRGTVRTLVNEEVGRVARRAVAGALPGQADVLAVPLASAAGSLAGDGVSGFLASQEFQRLWTAANTAAHRQLVSVLEGNSTAVATSHDVILNLALRPVSALAGARRAFRVLRAGTLALLILTPAAGGAALLAAPRRRRVLFQMAVGGTVTVLAASLAMVLLRSSLTARAQPRYQPVVGAVLDALTRGFFSMALWCTLGGLTLAAVALLTRRRR